MEETRRIGIVGRWVTHWSFWPTYAVGIVALLLVTRPWHYWFGGATEATPTTTTGADADTHPAFPFHFIRVHDKPLAPGPDGPPPRIGMMAITTAEAQPDAEWVECDGHALARADYPELSDAIGNGFGSDDETLVLPDFSDLYIENDAKNPLADWLRLGRATDEASAAQATTGLRFWIKAR